MDVSGRIAVVTGAGSGMGRELALQLAATGAQVAAGDVSPSALEETQSLAAELDGRLTTHLLDVSDESQQKRFADEVRDQHATDHIHLLFNNAGIGGVGSMITDPRELWERTFAIDWGGVYLGVRTFMPMLIAADEARIVNTSSVNGFWASIGPRRAHTAYSAAKFAVKGFTEALITDLRLNAPHVTAALVMPGHIGTGIIANSRKVIAGTDSDRLTDPELVAARARLIASGVDAQRLSDEDVEQIVADRAREFTDKAPMTAAEAARIILDGVRRDQWRILVGDDAHELDRRVRRDPEDAYTVEFYDSFADSAGWSLGSL
ncbi:SDR family NAD(P)-dependent oxidoreductase [Epidermidibacterium keratini]|uniref:SDR family NAD(P)-dependent oxidoreductase n=1 Tax=Epidermidibacterium keratini TaxID=1891644 RepID=A0A7M3T519_9ACTN|nr:SDR family NAD(P)-dependent oxidoreductase [Epidermidibacterium keratini]QHB98874.1 SDR family NAD(P)-dependent oxidoreductase [Epidermidibacterium keratini]